MVQVSRKSKEKRWGLWNKLIIFDRNHESVYLIRRRIVQTPLFGLYLHQIFRPDNDRLPHDHPWVFWSMVLRGGYREAVYRTEHIHQSPNMEFLAYANRLPFRPRKFPLNHAHRITSLDPGTLSLVLVGPKIRQWGFWSGKSWVPHYMYENDGESVEA